MTKKTKEYAPTIRSGGGYDDEYSVPTAKCNAEAIKKAVETERHYKNKALIESIDEDVVALNDEKNKMSAEGTLERAKTTKGFIRYRIQKQQQEEEENKTPNEWRKK
tara:strand:+ start:151 stop:471 length:321 start_codon:yes stop_codon:yes gene_type:complete